MFIIGFACKKENALDCFRSNGKEISQNRDISGFRGIIVKDKIDLLLVHGSNYKVEVLAGEHVIKNISTKIVGDNLLIENNNKCNFVRGYKRRVTVKVSSPLVDSVSNTGVGRVVIGDNFVQDTLTIKAESSGDIHVSGAFKVLITISSGNGDIYLSGSSNTLYSYSNGTNFLTAQNFVVSDYMFIDNRSLGDCYVNATMVKSMGCNIEDSGNIYYSGNPPLLNYQPFPKAKGKLIKQE